MKFSECAIIAFLSLVAIVSCGDGSGSSSGVFHETLPPIGEADRIEVRRHGMTGPSHQITEISTIEDLRGFINSYPAGWSVPLSGPPIGQVYFDFFYRDTFIGNFYVGPRFFGRDHGNFFSRSATDDEIAKLNSIVGFAVLE